MAITTKYLEELGIDKEIAEKIFIARNEEIEKEKAKLTAVQAELKEKSDAFNSLNSEFEALKATNASGEDWKAKFEALQADNDAKAKQALADKAEREREENNRSMFNKAVEAYGKTKDDWNGNFNEEGYYKLFIDALEAEENKGRAHKDILHDLTKNDATCWKGVTAVKLAGGRPQGMGSKYSSKEDIMAIKDGNVRRTEMLAHPQFFPELNK